MMGKILTVKRGPATPLNAASTEITLVNLGDQYAAKGGYIPQDQVRQITVNAAADTGVCHLVIDEETRQKLGLRVEKTVEVTLAGGGTVPGQVTEPVMACWKDRDTPCEALVLPGEKGVTLGRLPLFGLNLTVDPSKAEAAGAHGDAYTS
jgi:predicted aspartyl protease